MKWESRNQSILLFGLLLGCTVAPEFCGPAFLATMATMFAAYTDNNFEDPLTTPTKLPDKPTEIDLIRQAYTMDVPRMNDEGQWVAYGKVIELQKKTLPGDLASQSQMTTPDPSKSYCPKCGQQFGNAWQRIALAQHMWEVHAIPGKATFNGKTAKFGDDQ